MNTLSDKMNVVCTALIIQLLEFLCELAKQFMSLLKISGRYCPSLQEVNARDILTVVCPILFC